MRSAAICAGIAIALVGAIVVMGFQQNVVLLWAAATMMFATSIHQVIGDRYQEDVNAARGRVVRPR